MAKKILRVGVHTPIADLRPRYVQDHVSILVVCQVFETPYFYPGRAAKKAGGLPLLDRVIFREPLQREGGDAALLSARIRPDVRFSDGTVLSADHVVSSLQKIEHLRHHAEISAEGDRVRFKLRHPNPRFSLLLTHYNCAITLERGGETIGTGPFKVAEPLPGGGIRLVKNEHYRKDIAIDEVEFQVYPLQAQAGSKPLGQALMDGDLDFTNVLPKDDASKLRRVSKNFEPGNSTCLLFMNTERESLEKRELRHAIALSIDRHRVTTGSYSRPLAYTASSLLPPELGTSLDGLHYDVEKAKALLAEAGKAPRRLKLFIIAGSRPYMPHPEKTAKILVEQIGELGIAVDVHHAAHLDEFYEVSERGDYDLLLAGWITDTPDATDFVEGILASWNIPETGKPRSNCANYSRWASPQMDDAIRRLRLEGSAEALSEALRLVSTEVPFVPLMYGPTFVVHSFRVKNYKISPLGIPIFADLDVT